MKLTGTTYSGPIMRLWSAMGEPANLSDRQTVEAAAVLIRAMRTQLKTVTQQRNQAEKELQRLLRDRNAKGSI